MAKDQNEHPDDLGELLDSSTYTRTAREAAKLPERIGPYHIRSAVGAGGMGTVYLAEQTDPMRRLVAVKVIKAGMDSAAVLARFEAEEQALALMQHPNIAKVFDAGVSEKGRPYFAMEYVPGIPITQHCDKFRLDVEERLVMFTYVCGAIQHAHQKGVIHRDIKPSNVLVAFQDGRSIPKVIDFGVAKAIGQPLTTRTLFTDQGQLLGTPSYMSPEQAQMTAQDVDTRSDIYSLGVLLYELLTGTRPLEIESLKQAAFEEILRIIREVDPPKPSTRFSDLASGERTDSGALAHKRRADAKSLSRELRGDLDWITMKALEKDRSRRYESASGFSADIRRHLRDEPVIASPPSAAYRIRKFVRRNRATVLGVGTVLAVVIVGSIASAWLAVRATRAESLADRRYFEARREADKAHAVVDFLETTLAAASPAAQGRDVLVVDVLDVAARNLDSGSVTEPVVEAAARTAIGRTYLSLGRFEEAEKQVRTAVEIRRRVLGENHPDMAESLSHLAWLARERADYDSAEAMYRRCLAILEVAAEPGGELLADTMYELAVLLGEKGELDEAESLLQRSLSLIEELKGAEHPDAAFRLSELGKLHTLRGRYNEAEQLHRKSLSIFRAAYGDRHVRVAVSLGDLVEVLRKTRRLDEAERLSGKILEIYREEYGPDSPAVASVLVALASISRARADYAAASARLRDARAIYLGTYGDSHPYVATTSLALAIVLDEQGKSAAAAGMFPGIIQTLASVYGPAHWRVGSARSNYGACLFRLRRYEKAEVELLAAHSILAAAGMEQQVRPTASRLADLYEAWERGAEAERWRAAASAKKPVQ